MEEKERKSKSFMPFILSGSTVEFILVLGAPNTKRQRMTREKGTMIEVVYRIKHWEPAGRRVSKGTENVETLYGSVVDFIGVGVMPIWMKKAANRRLPLLSPSQSPFYFSPATLNGQVCCRTCFHLFNLYSK